MQALLYANLATRKLSESPGRADFEWPELIEGDTLRLALRFTETLGEEDIEIGSDSPEEGVNTTALIDHNASNAAVQTALRALLANIDFSLPIPAPDTVTVEAKDGSWLLRFQRNGEPYPHQLDLRAGRNALDPISFVRFLKSKLGVGQPSLVSTRVIPDFLVRQKELFGDRTFPDSEELLDELRADRF